jgi:ketosteroid isomerase-like protein
MSTTLSRDEMERIIRDHFDKHQQKDESAWDYIHDDIEFTFPEMELWDPVGHMAHGKEAYLAMAKTDFNALPDLACPIDRILIDGQTAVVQGRMTASNLSGLADIDIFKSDDGLDMSDRSLNMRHTFIFDFEDGKVKRIMCYYDLFSYMVVQLGIPAEMLMGMREMQRQAAETPVG